MAVAMQVGDGNAVVYCGGSNEHDDFLSNDCAVMEIDGSDFESN